MTITYSLTREEIVQVYFRSLASSPRLLLTTMLFSLFIGLLSLLASGRLSQGLTTSDLPFFLACTAGALVLFPVGLFVRGKTAARSLTITADGITTQIAATKGSVPWSKVKQVLSSAGYVVIVGRSGNAFFVPDRAFQSSEAREQFIRQIMSWTSPHQ